MTSNFLKKKSKSVSDFSFLFAANISSKLIGLISIAILARILSKTEISIIPVFSSIGSLGTVIFGFGFLPLSLKLIPSYDASNDVKALQIAKTVIRVNIFAAVVFSVVCFLSAKFISTIFFDTVEKAFIIQLLSIGFGFLTMNECHSYLLRCFARFEAQAKSIFLNNVIYNLLIVSCSLLFGLYGLIASCVVSAFFKFAISGYFLKDLYMTKVSIYPFRLLLEDAWSFYLEGFLNSFKREGDILIVGAMLGVEELAIYFIAKKVLLALVTFYQSVNSIIITRLSKLRENINEFKSEVYRIYNYQIFILLPLVIIYIAFVPLLIKLLGGAEYIDSIIPGSILATIPFIQYLFTFSYWAYIFIILSSFSRFKVSLFNVVILLPLILIMAQYFGLIGIVFAKLITIVLTGIYMIYFVEKRDSLSTFPISDFIKMVVIVVMSFLPFYLTQYMFSSGILISTMTFIGGVITYLLCVQYAFGNMYYTIVNTLSPIKIKNPIYHIQQYFA